MCHKSGSVEEKGSFIASVCPCAKHLLVFTGLCCASVEDIALPTAALQTSECNAIQRIAQLMRAFLEETKPSNLPLPLGLPRPRSET